MSVPPIKFARLADQPDNGSTAWFSAEVEDGGILLSDLADPLGYVWQTAEQAREIVSKIEVALAGLADSDG